jgi:RNA polymerase sigma-70 factor, ECF subfamily
MSRVIVGDHATHLADLSTPALRTVPTTHPRDALALPSDVVARVTRGDAAAFEALFRTYYGPLCSFGGRFMYDPLVAEDLVQDVFLAIWQGRGAWRVRTSVRSHLFAAVRSRALNLLAHQSASGEWEQVESQETPPGATERAVVEHTLRSAIDALPENCRNVMRLRWRDQLSCAEIAEVLDAEVNAVENEIARVLTLSPMVHLTPPDWRLLDRHLAGEATPRELDHIGAWLAEDATRTAALDLFQQQGIRKAETPWNVDAAWSRFVVRRLSVEQPLRATFLGRLTTSRALQIAVPLAIVASAVALWWITSRR